MIKINKTPYIKSYFSVDFSQQLGLAEALQSATVTAETPDGTDVTAQMISSSPPPAIAGSQVIFWYQNGTIGQVYIVRVKAVTSLGQQLESDVEIHVLSEV
jgi:hypothetical protein